MRIRIGVAGILAWQVKGYSKFIFIFKTIEKEISALIPDISFIYPFTEPTITPFTKYFCMKGYTAIIGMMATITVA